MSFTRKDNFLHLLRKIRIESHFPLKRPFRNLIKSSFNCFADKSTSCTTEKMDISSAKSFVIDDKFLLRSLIYIKKKRGPKMEPFRTSAIIGNHV